MLLNLILGCHFVFSVGDIMIQDPLSYAIIMCVAVDNGPRQGLDKFLKAASDDPDTVLHYEFMQDYKVLYLQPHI